MAAPISVRLNQWHAEAAVARHELMHEMRRHGRDVARRGEVTSWPQCWLAIVGPQNYPIIIDMNIIEYIYIIYILYLWTHTHTRMCIYIYGHIYNTYTLRIFTIQYLGMTGFWRLPKWIIHGHERLDWNFTFNPEGWDMLKLMDWSGLFRMKAQWIQGSFSGRFSEAELHSSSNPEILTLNKIVSFSFVLSLSIYILI